MALKFPQHLFLATGGKNNLRDIGKDWKLTKDYDAYEYWSSRYPIQCVKWWESFFRLRGWEDRMILWIII